MIEFTKDLAERFDFAAYHFQSGWEHDPDSDRETTDAEQHLVDLFEKLRDTIDQIPPPMIARTLEFRDFVGPEQFEKAVGAAIKGAAYTFKPNNALDFNRMLDLSLSFLNAA